VYVEDRHLVLLTALAVPKNVDPRSGDLLVDQNEVPGLQRGLHRIRGDLLNDAKRRMRIVTTTIAVIRPISTYIRISRRIFLAFFMR